MSDAPNKNNIPLSVRKAIRTAHAAGPGTQAIAESVAREYGARVTPLNYKTASSIMRKMHDEGKKIGDLTDIARTTIIAPRGQVNNIVKRLEKGGFRGYTVKRVKRQKFDTGYTGNIINLTHNRTGHVTEVQVNTPKMIYAKEKYKDAYKILGGAEMRRIHRETGQPAGWGHALYEDERTHKKGRNNGHGDSKRVRSASLSSGYYAHFQD